MFIVKQNKKQKKHMFVYQSIDKTVRIFNVNFQERNFTEKSN